MRFADYINEIKRRISHYTTETQLAIELSINMVYFSIWNKHNWWFARREVYFDTVAKYTTGTVSVTQYSATVTGSGTTFTSAMVNRKFILGGDTRAYIVKTFVSVTEITLDTVYLDSTKSGQSYGIYKHIYRLDDRAIRILWAAESKNRCKLTKVNERKFDRIKTKYDYSSTTIVPGVYIPRGQTTSPYYNTGNVSMTNGSATITGSGTSWDSGMIGMVFKVLADGVEYKITAVASATSLTISKIYDGTTNSYATSAYEIGPAGCEQIELWPVPEIVSQVWYKAQLRPLKMVADNDVPELPEQWHQGILFGALALLLPGRAINDNEIAIYKDFYDEFLKDIESYHNVDEDENESIDGADEVTLNDEMSWVMRND